jgi:hypothetical protein
MQNASTLSQMKKKEVSKLVYFIFENPGASILTKQLTE